MALPNPYHPNLRLGTIKQTAPRLSSGLPNPGLEAIEAAGAKIQASQQPIIDVNRRMMAIVASLGSPLKEVHFLDGTLPSQATRNRPALPRLRSIEDIRTLRPAYIDIYLAGYGVQIKNVPHNLTLRRQRLAVIIGCGTYY